MLEIVHGVARLTCDNPEKHLRGWAYPRGIDEKAAREFARAHGWSVDQHGRDLCPTCTHGAVA